MPIHVTGPCGRMVGRTKKSLLENEGVMEVVGYREAQEASEKV